MSLGQPWTGGYIFPWNLALRLEEAPAAQSSGDSTILRWTPENYQLGANLEVRVYLDGENIWKASELLIREAFLKHPWKLNVASRAIGEFIQEVAPSLADTLEPRLPYISREALGTKKLPSLDWLDDRQTHFSSAEATVWVRGSYSWRNFVVSVKGSRPCVFCQGPVWDPEEQCPSCAKKSGGLLERLGKLSWLLNKPKLGDK